MTVDLGVMLKWKDPRLASLDGCHVPLDDIWSPGIVVTNSGRLIASRPYEVKVGPGGEVTYLQRYFGNLATYHSLRDFPFDNQEFVIGLASVKYGEDEIKLKASDKFMSRTDKLDISDWEIGDVKATIESFFAPAFERQQEQYDLHIPAQRITGYYL